MPSPLLTPRLRLRHPLRLSLLFPCPPVHSHPARRSGASALEKRTRKKTARSRCHFASSRACALRPRRGGSPLRLEWGERLHNNQRKTQPCFDALHCPACREVGAGAARTGLSRCASCPNVDKPLLHHRGALLSHTRRCTSLDSLERRPPSFPRSTPSVHFFHVSTSPAPPIAVCFIFDRGSQV